MLLSKLIPDLHVSSIYEIDLDDLRKRGVKGIITDLDNTLIEWDRPTATPELIEWLELLKRNGFSVIVVSNNRSRRVAAFADPLGIPYIYSAKKPRRSPFLVALEKLRLDPHEIVVVGDQLFTDVLGGKRLGLYTILVVPVATSDGFFTRFNRQLERIALYWLRKRGQIPWEER